MSKNTQRNQSEINLGNATYERGFNDGLNGRPKTIKKTHRHAHRYHIGYRAGDRERSTTRASALDLDQAASPVRTHAYLPGSVPRLEAFQHPVQTLIDDLNKPRPGLLTRWVNWFLGR